jgi:hypothetical protein
MKLTTPPFPHRPRLCLPKGFRKVLVSIGENPSDTQTPEKRVAITRVTVL